MKYLGLELILTLIAAITIEPLLYLVVEKVQKKKKNLNTKKLETDPDSFDVKHSKDTIGMALVLGIFMLLCLAATMIPIFLPNSGMTKTEILIAIGIISALTLVIIYIIFRVLRFKVAVRGGKLFIFKPFGIKEYDIKQLTFETKQQSFNQYILVFNTGKRILNLH